MTTTIERIRLVLRSDEFPSQNPPTLESDAARQKMLRELGARKLRTSAERAFHWWPTLEETAIALCLYLGDLKDDAGNPIAVGTLARAVQAFSAAMDTDKRVADAAKAFLVEVVRVAGVLQGIHAYVETPDGKLVWRQFAESYPEWCHRVQRFGAIKRSSEQLLVPEHPWAAQRMLATQTMGPSDFGLLFRERGH